MADYNIPSLATHCKKQATKERKEKELAKRRGRPPKSALEKKRPVGRPKGEEAIIKEYKARMVASPKSIKVLEKIWEAALDDEHKHQSSAWKLVIDRILPVSMFDKDNAHAKPAINITIGGVGSVDIAQGEQEDNIIEGDVE